MFGFSRRSDGTWRGVVNYWCPHQHRTRRQAVACAIKQALRVLQSRPQIEARAGERDRADRNSKKTRGAA